MPDSLPQSAEIVVIGGGIVGCSTAYHLAKRGKKDVLLLERSKLTSGTTWHSAAQVRQLRSSSSLTTLMKYSAELYQSLEAETGQSTGWIGCGSLSIAASIAHHGAARPPRHCSCPCGPHSIRRAELGSSTVTSRVARWLRPVRRSLHHEEASRGV